MNANGEGPETIATEDVELENTLASVLFVLMMAVVLLLIGTANPNHRVVEPDGEVVEAEVIRRSADSGGGATPQV